MSVLFMLKVKGIDAFGTGHVAFLQETQHSFTQSIKIHDVARVSTAYTPINSRLSPRTHDIQIPFTSSGQTEHHVLPCVMFHVSF